MKSNDEGSRTSQEAKTAQETISQKKAEEELMIMVDLEEIRRKTVSVDDYISSMRKPFREKFLDRKEGYRPNHEAMERLKKETNKYVVVVFSAEWCKDCARNVPVLWLISEFTGLEVRVFGNIKTGSLNPQTRWKIPPSPPEVETFDVKKTPWILIFDKEGREIGKIIENPKYTGSVEEELLYLIGKR